MCKKVKKEEKLRNANFDRFQNFLMSRNFLVNYMGMGVLACPHGRGENICKSIML